MIYVENISKTFITKKSKLPGHIFKQEGYKKAIDNISFNIKKGEIVGYIGTNGAGKSTTIKIMSGIMVPTSGICKVNGIVPYENRIQNAKNIGVVFGQRTQLWWDLPLVDTFEILKKIYEVGSNEFDIRMDYLQKVLGIDEFMNKSVRTLSLGQRMRADLAASLLHIPKVLYLDEPTIGLDVIVKEKIREAIKKINNEYRTTIVLTTHDFDDIESLCDRILIIDKGHIIYDGLIAAIKEKYSRYQKINIKVQNIATFLNINIREIFNFIDFDIDEKEFLLKFKYVKGDFNLGSVISKIQEYSNIIDIEIINNELSDVIRELSLNDYRDVRVN